MTTSKFPARPSLESLRKQAKKLARGIVAGHAGAIARARAQLPHAELPLSQRDAQLMLAQSSRRRYAMASSLPAQRDCSISSTAEAFFPDRSGSLPRLATSMAFAPVLMRMATILQR